MTIGTKAKGTTYTAFSLNDVNTYTSITNMVVNDMSSTMSRVLAKSRMRLKYITKKNITTIMTMSNIWPIST